MKINIAITDEARFEVGQILNLLLADEFVLYTATRDYHWNVAGPEFIGLHQLFEHQYTESAEWIDQVAERTRATGNGARGHLADLVKAARTSADPGIDISADHMISELLALHEDMAIQIRTDAETCLSRYKDAGTSDFLTGLMVWHEKTAWMLRAHLEDEQEEAS